MRSRTHQRQLGATHCQHTQCESIRNWSMLANIICARTRARTHTQMLNMLFQMSHFLFKSWKTLKPRTHTCAHTNTCCDSSLYLRSAGPERIVIDLCWWAVCGFLRTESSPSVGFFSLAATRGRCSRAAIHWRPCGLISIFMIKLRFEVRTEVKR